MYGEKQTMQGKITYYRNEREIAYIHCENVSQSYPMHTHAQHGVAGIVLEGGVCITCGKVRRIFDAGEWFYIEKDTPHAIEPAEDKTYSLLSICIPDSYPVPVKAEEDTDAEQLKQLILGAPQRAWSIKDMACSISLSPYHMIRKFRKHCGLTPHQFQIQCRVRKAQNLLEEGRSVVEAAYATGFCDQSHFDRCFHKIVRLTPAEYKKTVKVFP